MHAAEGAFGASLVPVSQSVLRTFPREKHAKAMSLWGIGVMVAPIMGPTIGGWLTEFYSWRWVFYINLPFGILSLLGVLALVDESPIDRERRFDLFGFLLLGISVGALQLLLDRGKSLYWFESKEIIVEAIISAVFFYMFLVTCSRTSGRLSSRCLLLKFLCGTGANFVGVVLLATLALLPPFLKPDGLFRL